MIATLGLGIVGLSGFLLKDLGSENGVSPATLETPTATRQKTITIKTLAPYSQLLPTPYVPDSTITPLTSIMTLIAPGISARITEVAEWKEQGFELVPVQTPSGGVLSYQDVASKPNCFKIVAINETYTGTRLCVRGVVAEVFTTENYSQVILFKNSQDKFILQGEAVYFEGIYPGMCLAASGTIREGIEYPYYMDLSTAKLFHYRDCD